MKILLIFLALLAAAAVSPLFVNKPPAPATEKPLPDGGWKGAIVTDSKWDTTGPSIFDKSTLHVRSCQGKMSFFFEQDGGEISASQTSPETASLRGTHVISHLTVDPGDKPDWVEARRVEVIETDAETMHAQFSRSVNQVSKLPAAPKRALFVTGMAILKRYDNKCVSD